MAAIEKEIGDLLRHYGLTIGTVESGTGGLISHMITNVPGSSDYYKGTIVSYANETKMKIVGVKASSLKRYGAVSEQVAEEMAKGGKKVLNVDICISDTGIAGPSGATLGKGVGLFYLGMANKEGVFNRKLELAGSRLEIKKKVVETALEWLKEYLVSV
jgi:nicotinamide-nucleotide amidase